jgi:hypothetical protein
VFLNWTIPSKPCVLTAGRRFDNCCVQHYNTRRFHNSIGYVTPTDKLAGHQLDIFAARDRKLEAARQQRQSKRRSAGAVPAPLEEKPQKSDLTIQIAIARVASVP